MEKILDILNEVDLEEINLTEDDKDRTKLDYVTLEEMVYERQDIDEIIEKTNNSLIINEDFSDLFPEDTELDINGVVKENIVVKNYIPSQKEVDEIMARNEEERMSKEKEQELQNQTNGDKCGKCLRFERQTPNPKSVMGRCRYFGVMVSKFQTSCGEAFKLNNKPESAW